MSAPLLKRLIADPRSAVTRAGTIANAAHLSPAFLDEVLARYAGTRLGRQEIDGEIIEDRPDALWSRAMIEASLPLKTAHARQISARRAGGGALCARPRQVCRAAEAGAGGSDVRLQPRRVVVGRLARPARCAGLGSDGINGAGVERAADQGIVNAGAVIKLAAWARREKCHICRTFCFSRTSSYFSFRASRYST